MAIGRSWLGWRADVTQVDSSLTNCYRTGTALLNILALNPFHGESHRAFLDGWIRHSQHEFTVLGLPARKWKWRMRHAPVEFARQLTERGSLHEFDALFTTDMMDLPTLRGLCPEVATLPSVVYFHENQLTYPDRQSDESKQRDRHFAFTNVLTAACADAVWFNSGWHRDSFLTAARKWLKSMPDYEPVGLVDQVEAQAIVAYPGIDLVEASSARKPGPLRLVWVSRWEFDKNPEVFFAGLRLLIQQGVDFEVSVLGQSYGKVHECFDVARRELGERVRHFGFVPERQDYLKVLNESDAVVSTAIHEFFGIAVLEAVSAGCCPVVPDALAYPEVLAGVAARFHENTPESVAGVLQQLADELSSDRAPTPTSFADSVKPYSWPEVAASLDANILSLRRNA